MVVSLPSKQTVRVRFPLSAPMACNSTAEYPTVNRKVESSNLSTPATPDSPQGGEGVCKTPAVGMVGSIPTSGTWKYIQTKSAKNIGGIDFLSN